MMQIEMIPVSLPNRQLSTKDWKILETNLLANGLGTFNIFTDNS